MDQISVKDVPWPLVEPGAELTAEEMQRYSRHVLIPEVGAAGQRRLKNAKVLVLGAGGLGSPALLYLAAAGVGTIGIVDCDDVEMSNLQRQIVHSQADIGKRKVASAEAAIRDVNPLVRVVCHDVRLTSDNIRDVFSGYHLVLDGTDNFATRYLVNDACAVAGIPYVWGSIFRFEGQASVFWAAHGPNYRDVYPEPPPPGSVPSCAEGGVLGVLCATVGSVMATEAIKLICGMGSSLLGRLWVYNALDMSFRTVRLARDPHAEEITGLRDDYDEWCGAPSASAAVTEAADADVVTALELKRMIDAGEDFLLVDVRELGEHDLVRIADGILIPHREILSGAAGDRLPRDRDVVLYCKSGGRSGACLSSLRRDGFTRVRHLDGGVLAWVEQVAPELPRY